MANRLAQVSPASAAQTAERLTALEEMDRAKLHAQWRRLYRADPPKRVSRDLLHLAVAWKIREQAYGGLGASTKRRFAKLAKDPQIGDLTLNRTPQLKTGVRLVREWCGQAHTVTVLEDGFEWHGKHWPSLSVVAREITGSHWSGPRFFGLKGNAVPSVKAVETGDE